MTKQPNKVCYTYSANIPMVILGCPFMNTSEKALMSLLINQSNTFKKQRAFSIKKERLLFYMGIKKRALLDIVRGKLIPKGLIVDFKENSNNFDVTLDDFTNNPLIILTSKILELMSPKRKLFSSTQEAKIWAIFSNLKIEDILPILKTHEDADKFIRNLLNAKENSSNNQNNEDITARMHYNLMDVSKWYLNELCDYFFDEYKRITGKAHPFIRKVQCEHLMHRVWNSYSTSHAINTKKHIDLFLEAYSKKDGFDPKIQLLGNEENIYQVYFYIEYGCFPNEYQKTENQRKKLSEDMYSTKKPHLIHRNFN